MRPRRWRSQRRWPLSSALSLLLFIVCLQPAGAQAAPYEGLPLHWRRWLFVYAGGEGRPAYSKDDFLKLLTSRDSRGQPRGRLFDGALFSELSRAGRSFSPLFSPKPATGDDWRWYLDTLFSDNGFLTSLDSAAGLLSQKGVLKGSLGVSVMIPYPFAMRDSLWYDGELFVVNRGSAGQISAARRYVEDLSNHFRGWRYKYLSPVGMYWLVEDAKGSDTLLIREVASVVHSQGFLFFWVPYYNAPGRDTWKELGFDVAWLQPDYMFYPQVPPQRLDSAVMLAFKGGLGIDLEIDHKIFADSVFRQRFAPYLTMLEAHPEALRGPLSVYDDAGMLLKLADSKDPYLRDQYARFVRLMLAAGRQP